MTSIILKDIKDHRLQARKERDTLRSKVLTFFIGEVERTWSPSQVDDKKVISKLKSLCETLPDAEEVAILEFYLPRYYSAEWHRSFVQDAITSGVANNIGGLMKHVSMLERDGEFDRAVDKSLLNRFFVELS